MTNPMTTTIYLDPTVPAAAVQRVRDFAERTVRENPSWNGATIHVARGDFTCVDGGDELAGAALLADVYRAIDGA